MDLKATKNNFMGTLSTLSHCLSPVVHEMMVRGKLECKDKNQNDFSYLALLVKVQYL